MDQAAYFELKNVIALFFKVLCVLENLSILYFIFTSFVLKTVLFCSLFY